MAKVRRATAADVGGLMELGRQLHAEAPEYRDEPFDPDVARRWLAQRMATSLLAEDSAVFVAEVDGRIVGGFVGVVVPRWFNQLRVACEVIAFVHPAHRGGWAFARLVAAFKAWAREQGARKAIMGVSTGIHPGRTVRAYRRLGGKLSGHNLTFEL